MKFELFYPQWKDQAVTFSYDDGQIFDRRLVDIFNNRSKNSLTSIGDGMNCTFGHVCSNS